jgi:hypothetical protein
MPARVADDLTPSEIAQIAAELQAVANRFCLELEGQFRRIDAKST